MLLVVTPDQRPGIERHRAGKRHGADAGGHLRVGRQQGESAGLDPDPVQEVPEPEVRVADWADTGAVLTDLRERRIRGNAVLTIWSAS